MKLNRDIQDKEPAKTKNPPRQRTRQDKEPAKTKNPPRQRTRQDKEPACREDGGNPKAEADQCCFRRDKLEDGRCGWVGFEVRVLFWEIKWGR
jgi:hypothetical protein